MKVTLLAIVAVGTLAPSVTHAEISARVMYAEHRRVVCPFARSHAKKQKVRAGAANRPTKQTAELVVQPTLSVDDVTAKIQTVYMAGLRRCYRIGLASEPSLSGKITLQFAVDTEGRVLSDMADITPKFDACLDQMIGAWRFPRANEPDEATFKVSLVLAK